MRRTAPMRPALFAGMCGIALAMSLAMSTGCTDASSTQEGSQPAAAVDDRDAKPVSVVDDAHGAASFVTVDYRTDSYLAPEERWEDFDDGSPILDVSEPQIHANATSQRLTVELEDATFADEVAPGSITPTGGIDAWQVTSVDRVSDTRVDVELERAGGVSVFDNGAASAGLAFDADAIVVVPEVDEAHLETLELLSDESMTEDEIEQIEREADAASGLPEDAVSIEEEIQDASDGDGDAGSAEEAADSIEEGYAAQDAPEGSTYTVYIPIARPYLAVDVADSQIGEGTVTYRVAASDFTFPESVSAGDFRIEMDVAAPAGAGAPEVLGVTRIDEFEVDVEVSGDPLADESPLDCASLVMSADASGTGGEVFGMLTVPDAWVHATAERTDDGSIALDATLHNADEGLDADNTTVSVLDGEGNLTELDGVHIAEGDDGGSRITVDAASLPDDTDVRAINIDAGEVDHASGATADPDPAVIAIPDAAADEDAGAASGTEGGAASSALDLVHLIASPAVAYASGDSASSGIGSTVKSWLSSIASADTMYSLAKTGISQLASAGWSMARTTILADTFLGDRSNVQIYEKLLDLDVKIGELAEGLKGLGNQVSATGMGAYINDTNEIIAEISSEYTTLESMYRKVRDEKDAAKRSELVEDIWNKRSGVITDLVKDLGRLHYKVTANESTYRMKLFPLYDNLLSRTYNWAADAVPERLAYRAGIGKLWTDCTSMLYTLCGDEAVLEDNRSILTDLEAKTKEIDAVLGASDIPESEYLKTYTTKHAGKPTEVKQGKKTVLSPNEKDYAGKASLCYTTNSWFGVYLATDSPDGWDKALFTTKKHGAYTYYYSSANPFSVYDTEHKQPSWDSKYLTTAQARQLQERCPAGVSLQQEIRSFAGSVPKYLLTGATFDMADTKSFNNNSNWLFDVFAETSATQDSVFTEKKKLYEGVVQTLPLCKMKKTEKSKTNLADMFVLEKVS